MIFTETTDRFVTQTATARLDYSEDWSAFLALAPGDTLNTSIWTSSPAGLQLTNKTEQNGLATIWVAGGLPDTVYTITNTIETAQGRTESSQFWLKIMSAPSVPQFKTALFDRFTSVEAFKTASVAFTSGSFPLDGIRDDDIWRVLTEAEAEVGHDLRVLLEPTVIVSEEAPANEIAALEDDGTVYLTESSYDYDPASWTRDAWGFIQLSHRPVIRLDAVRFAYPSPENTILDVPMDWCRLDHRYGQLRIVPTGSLMAFGPMYTYMMTAISSGRLIPNMIQVRYVAGLKDPARDYPNLIGLTQRVAMLKMLKGGFLPQSGSVSGDGLSESMSFDMGKFQDETDRELGNLRDAIHGVRFQVF